jgi:hypothetical protein
MSRRWGAAFLVPGLIFVACNGESPATNTSRAERPAASVEDLYEGTGLVLDTPKRGPSLCLGAVNDSAPPQCRGIPLRGWSWDAVEGEDGGRGWLWGDYTVTGVYAE